VAATPAVIEPEAIESVPSVSVPPWIVPVVVKPPVPEKLFEPNEKYAGVTTVQFADPGAQVGANVSPNPYGLVGGTAKTYKTKLKIPAETSPIIIEDAMLFEFKAGLKIRLKIVLINFNFGFNI
jgi:hypothetical protein